MDGPDPNTPRRRGAIAMPVSDQPTPSSRQSEADQNYRTVPNATMRRNSLDRT
jgi:hypothetical protein